MVPPDRGASGGPGFGKMLARALLRRCPWCGDHRAWFRRGVRGWFGREERCRRCGLRWDRNTDGHELGALTINILLTMGVLVIAMVIGIVLTAPDIAVAPLVVSLVIAAVIGPIVSYPFGSTIWMAIDLAARRPSAEELAADAAALAAERSSSGPAGVSAPGPDHAD